MLDGDQDARGDGVVVEAERQRARAIYEEVLAERTRQRAYEIYEERVVLGRSGDEVGDWLEAETEIRGEGK